MGGGGGWQSTVNSGFPPDWKLSRSSVQAETQKDMKGGQTGTVWTNVDAASVAKNDYLVSSHLVISSFHLLILWKADNSLVVDCSENEGDV